MYAPDGACYIYNLVPGLY